MNPYETKTNKNTLIVTFHDVTSGWEQWVLISSDRHWDSIHSDRAMQKRHLEEARERNALVMDLGDLFDAMQGRNDRRGSKSSIRPEHQGADYFTRLIESATDWFEPYADLFLLLATGNHETSILRHNEINLTWHLARMMEARARTEIHKGKYAGWVKFQFRQGERRYWNPVWTYYHHGSGGSSPVTKGVIQTNRRGVYLPDANVILSGHTHQTWMVPITRERINDGGTLYKDTQLHVSVPSYKSTFGTHEGYEAEKGYAPTETGAIWWRLYYFDGEIKSEFTWAK